jgi:hypothetical protein
MFRRAILALCVGLAATSFVLAQEPTAPPVPEDALAPRELIAWSSLQTPQPAQKPVPPIQTQTREPNQDSAQGSQRPADDQAQQQRAQSHKSAHSLSRDEHIQPR